MTRLTIVLITLMMSKLPTMDSRKSADLSCHVQILSWIPYLHQGDTHGIFIAGSLRPHQDLVCCIRYTQHRFQFFSRDKGIGVDTERTGSNDSLDAVLPGYPVIEGDINGFSNLHSAERRVRSTFWSLLPARVYPIIIWPVSPSFR